MLMEVKNHFKMMFLSIKYNILKEMVNPVSFASNIIFMALNNASFIIQWVILFSLKDEIGGYSLNTVLLLWGLSASAYGFSNVLFGNAYKISDLIVDGKLDAYLVQPKNVLLNVITSYTKISAIGDIIYGYVMLTIIEFNTNSFILFTLFSITGGIILTSLAIIFGSLAFYIVKVDAIANTVNGAMINFATYPDGIFKGISKIFLFTIVPVAFTTYIPINIMERFDMRMVHLVLGVTLMIVLIALLIFNRGLKRYSSSNLMSARV